MTKKINTKLEESLDLAPMADFVEEEEVEEDLERDVEVIIDEANERKQG